MNTATIEHLEASFNLLAPRGEELIERFYSRLFAENPALRPMFPESMADQRKKLLASLALVIANLRNLKKLEPPLKELGTYHQAFGTQPEHYGVVRDTLLYVMAEMAGSAWNDELDRSWRSALDLVASVMLKGTEEVNSIRKAA